MSKPYQPPPAPKNLPINAPWALFGGISPKRFMQEYWQKKPLLIRGAIPAFTLDSQNGSTNLASPISYEELVEFANQENLESRLIQSDPWRFQHGPFQKKTIPNLNKIKPTFLKSARALAFKMSGDGYGNYQY